MGGLALALLSHSWGLLELACGSSKGRDSQAAPDDWGKLLLLLIQPLAELRSTPPAAVGGGELSDTLFLSGIAHKVSEEVQELY